MGVGREAGRAPEGYYTGVARKTELEVEQSCMAWDSQWGHMLGDNDEGKDDVI